MCKIQNNKRKCGFLFQPPLIEAPKTTSSGFLLMTECDRKVSIPTLCRLRYQWVSFGREWCFWMAWLSGNPFWAIRSQRISQKSQSWKKPGLHPCADVSLFLRRLCAEMAAKKAAVRKAGELQVHFGELQVHFCYSSATKVHPPLCIDLTVPLRACLDAGSRRWHVSSTSQVLQHWKS